MPRIGLPKIILAATLAAMGSPGHAAVPAVVTDIPVVHSLVSMVMGDLGQPKLLLESGADAHSFQLRPSQVSALQAADLVVWIGPEMTPWLERALAATPPHADVALLHTRGTIVREYGPEAGDDHATDPDAAAQANDHAPHIHDDEHNHEGLDPHAWLDTDNATLWVGLITDALVAQDPGNAVAYRANASLALNRIETAARAVAERLSGHADEPIVTAHDAYGYFADHFGVTVEASLAKGDAAEPGAAHLSKTRALLEGGGVACIFSEVGRDPAPVISLADGTEVRVGRELDPEGRGMVPGVDLYPKLLTRMGAVIADCLEGH